MSNKSDASSAETDEIKRAYAIVGELVMLASALDNQMNVVCITALGLDKTPMLEPVVASLDSARKVEILKALAQKISSPSWKKSLVDYAKAVEKVNRARNVAAHSLLEIDRGKAVLTSTAAAKLFKSIDLQKKTVEKVALSHLEDGIRIAETTLHTGENVIANFEKADAEFKRRFRDKGPLAG
ncbi:MAG: hypothetical protein JWM36_3209 [Hyphomicrobiales bacterium]|nr:hypothetical protein [Hyphomicrobiales bacterium]